MFDGRFAAVFDPDRKRAVTIMPMNNVKQRMAKECRQ
jgi:hypothetical protein